MLKVRDEPTAMNDLQTNANVCRQQLSGDTSSVSLAYGLSLFFSEHKNLKLKHYCIVACISMPHLNSMHVEANERVLASCDRRLNPNCFNSSQRALGMNTHPFKINQKVVHIL